MPGGDDLTLLVKRAEALAATLKTEDGANLLQGQRANNILAQAEARDGVNVLRRRSGSLCRAPRNAPFSPR